MKKHQKGQSVQFIKDASAVVWPICTSVGKDSYFHVWLIAFQWVIVPMSDSFMVYCYTRRPKNGYLTQNWVFGPITPEPIGKFNSLWSQTNIIWSWSMGRKPIKSTTDRPDMKPISLQARSASAISTFIGYYRWDKQQQKFERFFFFLEKSAVLLGRPMWPVSLDDFNNAPVVHKSRIMTAVDKVPSVLVERK